MIKLTQKSDSNSSMSGAEALVASLRACGVDTIFGLPGVQLDNIFNALYQTRDDVKVIHTRQEQGAAYMAFGYACSTGMVGTYLVVPGPGILNTPTALCTAYSCNTPVLALTGNIPSQHVDKGLGILHEIKNQDLLFQSITKWCCRANSPNEAPKMIQEAFSQMLSGRRGPVLCEMPVDVTYQKVPINTDMTVSINPDPEPRPEDLNEAARLLGESTHPLIYLGGGGLDAGDQLKTLAEMLEAPVVSTKHGKGTLTDRHYLSQNLLGGEMLWSKVDVVLAVGTRFLDPYMYWGIDSGLKVIRIDIDPVQIIKPTSPDIGLVTSAKLGMAALVERLSKYNRKRASRKLELDAIKDKVNTKLSQLTPQKDYSKVIREALPDDGILVPDVTQLMFYTWFGYPVYRPRTLIFPGYQDSLGYAFATAMGVKVAHPATRVLCITGDGGFMLTMPELATAVYHRINLVTVIFNDKSYGNVRRLQKERFGGNFIASDLHNPDFVALAESFGAVGLRAETPTELATTLDQAFHLERPVLIEVPVGEMPAWQEIMPRDHIRGVIL